MALRITVIFFLMQALFSATASAQGYMRFGNTQQTTTEQQQQQQQQQPTQPASAPSPIADADIPDWRIPPLQTLMETAQRNSPLVKFANANIQLSQYELTDAYRTWLKNIHIVADSRYGSMINYANLVEPGMGSLPRTTEMMWNYGAGLTFYMPFSEFFDRRRTIQKSNLKIEQARIQREEVVNTVNLSVIEAYYEVLSAQKTLSMLNEFSLSATMLYEQARMDFNANRMTLADYTTATETYLTSRKNVEIEKFNLMKAIRILEVIAGVELIK